MKVIKKNFGVISDLCNGLACTDGKKIYVDKKFYKLPHVIRKFIIFHEIGHVECGHFKLPNIGEKQEEEADKYAMEQCGWDNLSVIIEWLEKIQISLSQEIINSIDDCYGFNFDIENYIEKSNQEINDRIINLKVIKKSLEDEEFANTVCDIYQDISDLFGSLAEEIRNLN